MVAARRRPRLPARLAAAALLFISGSAPRLAAAVGVGDGGASVREAAVLRPQDQPSGHRHVAGNAATGVSALMRREQHSQEGNATGEMPGDLAEEQLRSAGAARGIVDEVVESQVAGEAEATRYLGAADAKAAASGAAAGGSHRIGPAAAAAAAAGAHGGGEEEDEEVDEGGKKASWGGCGGWGRPACAPAPAPTTTTTTTASKALYLGAGVPVAETTTRRKPLYPGDEPDDNKDDGRRRRAPRQGADPDTADLLPGSELQLSGAAEGFCTSGVRRLVGGVGHKQLADSAITASSYDGTGGGRPLEEMWRSRLDYEGTPWCAGINAVGQYINWNFGANKVVARVLTRGRPDRAGEWVKSYKIFYHALDEDWREYPAVFPGNQDENSVVMHAITPPILASEIRLVVQSWKGHIALRADFIGCDPAGVAAP